MFWARPKISSLTKSVVHIDVDDMVELLERGGLGSARRVNFKATLNTMFYRNMTFISIYLTIVQFIHIYSVCSSTLFRAKDPSIVPQSGFY